MTAESPLYRVTAPTYLDGGYYTPENHPEGGLVWEGEPNAALEPINVAAEKRVKAYEAEREKRRAEVNKPLSRALKDAGVDASAAEKERDAANERAEKAEARVDELKQQVADLTKERDDLAAQIAKFDGDNDGFIGGSAPREGQNPNPTVDEVVKPAALTDGEEVLAPAPRTVETEDDKKPTAAPKAKRTPEEQARRQAAIKKLRDKDVTFFAGATTEELEKQAAEA